MRTTEQIESKVNALLRELREVDSQLKELEPFEPVSQEEENNLLKLKFTKVLLFEKIKLLGWVCND